MKILNEVKKQYNPFVSQGYGLENTKPSMMEFYKNLGIPYHNGVDIVALYHTPIYYGVDDEGEVCSISTDLKSGYGVVIKSAGYKHIYWHLAVDGIKCQIGQKMKMGDLIGLMDNTGYSTGTHLHRGLKQLDADGNVMNRDNGVDGAIDPWKFMIDEEIPEIIPPLTKDLFYGQTDKEVVYLKRKLNKLGYLTGVSYTEFFGPETLKALRAFQRSAGICTLCLLKRCGTNTRIKLNEL